MSTPDCSQCKLTSKPQKQKQKLYRCSLCGEYRCESHILAVAAADLQRQPDAIQFFRPLLVEDSTSGWYYFCDDRFHIPKGVTLYYGLDRKTGRIVDRIPEYERDPQLSIFQMEDLHRIMCMYCGVVVCSNRRAQFRDQRLFTRLAKSPQSVRES